MVVIIFVIVTFLLLFLIRPITVLVHELGHAIPALILTKRKVDVYIGSYGDSEKGVILNLSRLRIFFKYNPILWKYGLVTHHDTKISFTKQFLITLSGPFSSIIFGSLICFFSFYHFEEGIPLFIGVLVFTSCLIDFFININPDNQGIRLHDGTIAYNDGQQLLQLLKYQISPKEYKQANELYNNKEYLKAGQLYKKLVEKGNNDYTIFQLAISAFMLANKHEIAKRLIKDYSSNLDEDENMLTNIGLCYSLLGEDEKSIEMYDKALSINPNNAYALNNRGYQKNLNKEFKAAIIDFDKALKINPNFAYSLNNRGRAKIELGMEEEGFKDIMHSINLDEKNAYAYRNLGIYYIRKKNKTKALENLELAIKLDSHTLLVQELLTEAKNI